ncbi:MAG: hypothetical protein ACTTKR_00805 [Dialister pneumosintes]
MDFLTSLFTLFNIGFLSHLVARLTGANASILIFCGLLIVGATPFQIAGIMVSYLVLIKLALFTQGRQLTFKNFQIFRGWILWASLAVTFAALFIYPFGALTLFLLMFLLELTIRLGYYIPEQLRIPLNTRILYIAIASALMVLGVTLTQYIPAETYKYLGISAALLSCGFFWWVGNDRKRFQNIWDYLVISSFFFSGLFGFEFSDWVLDLHRAEPTKNRLTENLPLIMIPAFFIAMLASNLLFNIFPLSGMVLVLFGTLCIRLFGFYMVSGRGKMSIIALAFTILAVICVLLVDPKLTGFDNTFDNLMNSTFMFSLDSIKSLF